MVVRLKDALVDSIEETETRRLKILTASSKESGTNLSLELPDVLCEKIETGDQVDIVLDEEPIAASEKTKLYAEGTVFKVSDNGTYQVVGTIGGLRMVLSLPKPTPSQKKTFLSGRFYIALT